MRGPRVKVSNEVKTWLGAAGAEGRRHLMAEAFGHADEHWERTGLPLFDPAFRRGPPLPAHPDPSALYATLHPNRREQGVYYTPAAVVDEVVRLTWSGAGSVLDPAVGGGAFLLGVLRAVPHFQRREFAATALFGVDADPLAVLVAQAAVALFADLDREACVLLQRRLTAGNSLVEPLPEVDTVLTNPPFQSRLRAAAGAPTLASLQARHGAAVGPYTDVSVVFLLNALQVARRAVGIVLPASVCATRDAAAAREVGGTPSYAWTLPSKSFSDVGVALVALGFQVPRTTSTRRFAGLPPVADTPGPASTPWAALLRTPDPAPWTPAEGGPSLGEVTRIDADFRDEYYAVRGHIEERGEGVRLITSGNIGLGTHAWGTRRTRIHKAAWLAPTAPIAALHPRQSSRLGPAVFVATQTRLLEAFADTEGRCVGLTPVLTLRPIDTDVLDVLAVCLSPAASAWAERVGRGSALELHVLKLSATQLRRLPLPPVVPPEARALAAAVGRGEPGALDALATCMNEAYGAPESLLAWWRRRRDASGVAAPAQVR